MAFFRGICLCLVISSMYGLSVGSYEYDHFVFTQQWAEAVCTCPAEDASFASCHIPDGVKTWTIHGLWPSLGKSKYPDYCNRSWKFEESKILDIERQMLIHWPQYFSSSNSRIDLWKHEWEKHGTCCTDLEILNSEHKYFSVGLNLNKKYDLSSMLDDAGIAPSKTKSYQLEDIRAAVAKRTGHRPFLHCCKADSKQRIEEIMICLDKKLTLIDCIEDDEDCAENSPVYYRPIIPGNELNLP